MGRIIVSEDFVNALVGSPPTDWTFKVKLALQLCEKLLRQPIARDEQMEDILLMAAIAYYATQRPHPAGFVLRARQIAQWMNRSETKKPADVGPSSWRVLERKVREIGRMIAKHLFAGEDFLLIIYARDDESRIGTISSVPLHEQIDVLKRHLKYLKDEAPDIH